MAYDPFGQANQSLFRTLHHRWRQHRSSVQILRSQVGFAEEHTPSQPAPCRGCINYHGIAYGSTQDARSRLICAIHPQGWRTSPICPDWRRDLDLNISA